MGETTITAFNKKGKGAMNFDNAEVRRIIIYFPWEIPSFPVFLYLPEKTFGSFLFLPSSL